MQCGLCQRPVSNDRPLNCELCAQGAIYHPRIALVQSLLKNESLGQQVEKQISAQKPQKSSLLGQKTVGVNAAWNLERCKADKYLSEDRTGDILGHTKSLREEIQYIRLDIAKRKAHLTRRRKDMVSARQELSRSQKTSKGSVEASIERTTRDWESQQEHTRDLRLAHCAKTARLFSLQHDRRHKNGAGRDIYSIGFIPIHDLRELNNAHPSQVTTMLLHLANLVHLTSHHLSLKLPAQILLPSSSYPYPAILSPTVSYKSVNPILPSPTSSSHGKTTSLRHPDQRSQPRARPLVLMKQLSVLEKEDIHGYDSVTEGITLLAWNIAWLCKTQGLDVGQGGWEELCAWGKNLYTLLLSPVRPPRPSREPSLNRDATDTPKRGSRVSDPQMRGAPPPAAYFSHGTVYGFLGSAAGTEYMRTWTLGRPLKLIEKIQARLHAERAIPEWEVLEGDAWTAEDEGSGSKGAASGKAVNGGVVGMKVEGKEGSRPGRPGPETVLEQTGILVKPVREEPRAGERVDEAGKGGSGWTKIRGR